ncbi:hypothetical protein [Enterovirga sp.]|uniref:hypothetical protein n=1 Tax=Enterovirga sp. TaxID=2026350 RepID=UPI002612680C|nr:hypothetical protein [Enterovirga sp.]MDB5592069.1 hypothetical protein [Enterovirga sp.]
MVRFVTALGALCFVSAPALADQCAWIPAAQANAALKHLTKGTVIQEFCGPCKDTRAKKTVINSTSLKTQNPQFVTVVANGTSELDIAYVYVKGQQAAWTNLAALVGCAIDASDTPRTLPPAMVAP